MREVVYCHEHLCNLPRGSSIRYVFIVCEGAPKKKSTSRYFEKTMNGGWANKENCPPLFPDAMFSMEYETSAFDLISGDSILVVLPE